MLMVKLIAAVIVGQVLSHIIIVHINEMILNLPWFAY